MRELRTCPVEGTVVLLNDAWLDHPPAPHPPLDPCPWCAPPGAVITSVPGFVGPAVYAVPHPTPALGVEGDPRVRRGDDRVWRDALGAHEVVYGAHEGDHRACLRLVKMRMADLRRDRRLRGFRAFHRRVPGRHATWQLVALPFDVPPSAPSRWREGELRDGQRVIAREGGAVAVLAWAPRTPLEAWVLPDTGEAGFADADPGAVVALATTVAERIQRALGGAAIDVVLVDGEPWRLELRPEASAARPVEEATGLPLHGAFPERAAAFLRGD